MKIIFSLALIACFSLSSIAQETNNGKKLWAKSMLNEKAPKLVVEEWLSEKPDTKGKFVLVDFWATWCGPCRSAIPHLNQFQQKFADELVVVGISDEPVEKIESLQNPLIKYYSARDSRKIMYNKLEVKGIPHCILISPAGKVIWEGFPFLNGYELTEKVIADLIAKYQSTAEVI